VTAGPVLWPEHFDVSLAVGEVTLGVSTGDDVIVEPYAYVGPWQVRRGDFWAYPFGAARRMTDLAAPADVAAFFENGLTRASLDPPA
jgi:hypothetical protein